MDKKKLPDADTSIFKRPTPDARAKLSNDSGARQRRGCEWKKKRPANDNSFQHFPPPPAVHTSSI